MTQRLIAYIGGGTIGADAPEIDLTPLKAYI